MPRNFVTEARTRARRRRTSYLVLVLVLVILAAGLFVAALGHVYRAPPRVSTPGFARSVVTASSMQRVPTSGFESRCSGRIHARRMDCPARNASSHQCSLSGYGAVQDINRWNGAVLNATKTRNPYLGGWNSYQPFPPVTLRPRSGIASFRLTAVDAAIDNPSRPE